ncbi:MAG: type II toxin-antitoxin system HigB family toxin [Chloroflexota bacterium]
MHIISPKTIREFWDEHPQAESALRSWVVRVHQAKWQNFAELRSDFPSADLVGRLTVFNIGGNNYRLIVRVEFWLQKVFVRHVLMHSEYDKENWKNDPWF